MGVVLNSIASKIEQIAETNIVKSIAKENRAIIVSVSYGNNLLANCNFNIDNITLLNKFKPLKFQKSLNWNKYFNET